jgi:D-psicose/D-tagatose/L-ribulose 3-epimerase
MKLGLINSAWFGSRLEGRAGLEKTREIGFDTVDVFADPLDLSDEQRSQLIEDVRDVGLPVPSLCCVALGIADFNPAPQRFHVDRAKKHIDLASDLGANNLLLVLGEYVWQKEVIPPEVQWETAVQNTRELGEHAVSKGMEIALELEPFDLSLVNTIEKMGRFLKDVDHPAVKANVDCSHLWLMRIDASEISRLSGRIAHVHISDCDGEVHGDLPPGRGNTPLKSYLEGIRDAGYDGVVSIELEYSPEPERIVEWVEEAYRETARLMQETGVRDEAGR